MSTESAVLSVHGQEVDVVRKRIKNLHLSVYPPTGRVRVAVPLHISDESVRLAVVTRFGWILRQQRKFLYQARWPAREYVGGESVYFQGRRYLLEVKAGTRSGVRVRTKSRLELTVRPGADLSARTAVVDRWYREQLTSVAEELIAKWEPLMGVKVQELVLQRMARKWGTCNEAAGRIRLNVDLARLPLDCVEYVVVHEMTHLLVRNHGERFQALMDQFLPNWRSLKGLMSEVPLEM